jgi:hypothetical protein
LIWPSDYSQRLREWNDLRTGFSRQEITRAVSTVNDWWFRAPISARYLHWDDSRAWPGPWDLLKDDIYCDLSRGLGMLYTLAMLEDPRIARVTLAVTDQDNLVLIDDGKYILNWAPGQLLNISSKKIEIKKSINAEDLLHLMG